MSTVNNNTNQKVAAISGRTSTLSQCEQTFQKQNYTNRNDNYTSTLKKDGKTFQELKQTNFLKMIKPQTSMHNKMNTLNRMRKQSINIKIRNQSVIDSPLDTRGCETLMTMGSPVNQPLIL